MPVRFPEAGSVDRDFALVVHETWAEEYARLGGDPSGLHPQMSFEEKAAWAHAKGLSIAAPLSRASTKIQRSVPDQTRDCTTFAARNGMYVPPDVCCMDIVTGRQLRRDGLDRMNRLLEEKVIDVMLVLMVSRLMRIAYRSVQFVQEQVVERGLRCVSVSQGIDTKDEATWRAFVYMYGLMDEMLLETIAQHVRSSLFNLARDGFVTGALCVGFERRIVEGARPTNRGLPRTVPAVNGQAAELINQHADWMLSGVPPMVAWERWVRAGGPRDPRSTSGKFAYGPYRRLFSNPRLIGIWPFGKLRNKWSHSMDRMEQIERPQSEVVIVRSEELRILPDEKFHGLQELFAGKLTRRRGPNRAAPPTLSNRVIHCFKCAACVDEDGNPVRFWQAGAHGRAMRCANGRLCLQKLQVDREEAVSAVVEALCQRIREDRSFVERTVAYAVEADDAADGEVCERISRLDEEIRGAGRRIDFLCRTASDDSEAAQAEWERRIDAAREQQTRARAEKARLEAQLASGPRTITAEQIREVLCRMEECLRTAGTGALGEDSVFAAVEFFERLTGEDILVHAVPRPGRAIPSVRATFVPQIVQTVRDDLGDCRTGGETAREIATWLRQPPKLDLVAPLVYELIDEGGKSIREAVAELGRLGHDVTEAYVWQARRRHFAMIGEPVPKLPFNNGKPRTRRAR